MRSPLFFLLVFLPFSYVFSQTGALTGRIISATTNENLGFLPIKILQPNDSTIVKGGLTKENGTFEITDIKPGQYILFTTFFGYQEYYSSPLTIIANETKDLASIPLQPAKELLDEIVVINQQELVKYEIDKKVINISQDYANSSATAFEILGNVPSITTDIDGNLSLRGSSSYTLLIDGKPTQIDANDALKMIPAGNIQDIEIMTNPSSRYDAEGVSGIINIVTKKSKIQGTSALINLGGGTWNAYNGDVNVQMKKEKIALNFGLNYRTNDRPSFEKSIRTTKTDSSTNTIAFDGDNNRSRSSYGANLGFEWSPNAHNSFNIGGELSGFQMGVENELNFTDILNDTIILGEYSNYETGEWDFKSARTFVDYFHYFDEKKKHILSMSAFYTTRDGKEKTETQYFEEESTIPSGGNLNTEVGPSQRFRFKVDYTLPFKNENQFEAGLQAEIGSNSDNTDSYRLDPSIQEYVINPLFSTDVTYERNVYAAYSIFNGKIKDFGYQFGLRAEYTDRTIASTNGATTKVERLDFFPAFHSSYKKSDKTQFMFSYSRKIERPRSWYLEPFITWSDLYSVRTGNSNLIPEYINSFELGWIQNISKKTSFSLEIFHRMVNNKIERIQRIYEDNITITMPENVGTSISTGLETSFDHNIKKWWRFTLSGSAYYYQVKGQAGDLIFDRETINWTARTNNSFTLKKEWKIQLSGVYNSAEATAQGTTVGFFSANFALKKDFFKRKISTTLQVRDVFSTQKRESSIVSQNLSIYNLSEPRTPTFVLGVSFKLNNYKEKRNQLNDSGDDF